MTLRVIGGMDTGINSVTLTDTEFTTISVVADGTLAPNSSYQSGDIYSLKAATGATNGVSYGEVDWGADDISIWLTVRVMFPAVPSAITALLAITDSVPTQLFSMRVNASGFWQLNNNANGTIYTSTLNKPIANLWHRIEIYWKQDAAVGEFTVKIDGVADVDLTQTALNNGAAKPRRIRLGVVEAQTNAPNRYLDSWIVNSDAAAPNNSWVGNAYVRALVVKNTDLGNWTVVDGGKADWQCMQERPWNSNASDMIKSSVASQEDRMTLLPLGSSAGPVILGAMPVLRQRRGVAGSAAGVTVNIRSVAADGTLSASLDSGSTTWKTFLGVIQETDPNTAAVWTLAGINAMILRLVHDAGTNECDVNAVFVYIAFTNNVGALVSPLAGVAVMRSQQGVIVAPLKAEAYQRRGRMKHGNVII